ncbi:MAG TPA: hypothetical protein VIU61_30705, partial [Kofleriaceae bacterium]
MLQYRLPAVVAILGLVACGRGGAKQGAGSGSGSGSAGSETTPGGAGGAGGGAAAGSAAAGSGVAVVEPEPTPVAEDLTLGPNLALAALGGHVVSPAEAADHEWRVSNLLDGFPVIRGLGAIQTSLGWRPETAEVTQSVVIAFREDREATIAAVVIDTASSENLAAAPTAVPKDIEVLASTKSATEGFTRVAVVALPAVAGE